MRYATFSLYWERWGGYPDRSYPFGAPSLVRVLASSGGASVTLVDERSSGPDVMTVARTSRLPVELVSPLPGLISSALAVSGALIDDPGDGDYQVVDELTGVGEGAFHLSLAYTTPSAAVWTPAARELMDALNEIRLAAGELP